MNNNFIFNDTSLENDVSSQSEVFSNPGMIQPGDILDSDDEVFDNTKSIHDESLIDIIKEKNTLIDNLNQSNINYGQMISGLNDVISNIRKSVSDELSLISCSKDRENIIILKHENSKLENEIKNYKLKERYLHEQLEESNKSYLLLNSVFISKIKETIDIKSRYIQTIINLKKHNQNMLVNLSQRIDDLQYKLKDKDHEISMSCRVCYSNAIDCILNPCNHLVMCKSCIVELSKIDTAEFKCPLCQVDITDFTDVYLPE